jgi:Trk K+ transport system NAD-binding subunit
MGCGRVGSGLANDLEAAGHSVSIIDQNQEAFRRLGADFKGQTIAGVGFDRDILLEAGIEKADAFAAVSNGDNSNILAARVARETYGVEKVVARIYDPARAEIYQRLGIPTVATVLDRTTTSELENLPQLLLRNRFRLAELLWLKFEEAFPDPISRSQAEAADSPRAISVIS